MFYELHRQEKEFHYSYRKKKNHALQKKKIPKSDTLGEVANDALSRIISIFFIRII
jgi:hypothetical protein